MAASSSRGRSEQLQKYKERENTTSPERNLKPNKSHFNNKVVERRIIVPVVYYLSRNGHLEHPHFMEVSLSSSQGLFLRDVISRLNLLRGNGIASQYSWSSKRSYKNGYVWHDLEENDFIHPVHGGEYVLKGSEILETVSSSSVSKSLETSLSFSAKNTPELPPAGRNRRRNQSWGGVDLHEYKVYKAESTRELLGAADASTQTDEKRRRRSRASIKEEIEEEERENVEEQQSSTELSREEISPPPSDSSPETLESLIKADGRLILATSSSIISSEAINQSRDQFKTVNRTAGYCPSGRMKASSVIMSLISCGSIPFRDCGVAAVKDHGMSLITHYKTRMTRGGNQTVGGKDQGGDQMIIMDDHDDVNVMEEIEKHASNKFAKMALEDKEYFSGSLLMETNNKDEFSSSSSLKLKRSSSYNADRSSHLKIRDRDQKDEEGVRAKCIPRRPKTQSSTNNTLKHCHAEVTSVNVIN